MTGEGAAKNQLESDTSGYEVCDDPSRLKVCEMGLELQIGCL